MIGNDAAWNTGTSATFTSSWPFAYVAVRRTSAASVSGAEYGAPLIRARSGYRSTGEPVMYVAYTGRPMLTCEKLISIRWLRMFLSCCRSFFSRRSIANISVMILLTPWSRSSLYEFVLWPTRPQWPTAAVMNVSMSRGVRSSLATVPMGARCARGMKSAGSNVIVSLLGSGAALCSLFGASGASGSSGAVAWVCGSSLAAFAVLAVLVLLLSMSSLAVRVCCALMPGDSVDTRPAAGSNCLCGLRRQKLGSLARVEAARAPTLRRPADCSPGPAQPLRKLKPGGHGISKLCHAPACTTRHDGHPE